jgi:hypothetical protein
MVPLGKRTSPDDIEISNVWGELPVVDRLLSFRKASPFDTTVELAAHLVESLQEACADDDLYEEVKQKVRVFTPDGASDEQLAGQLAADEFPNMVVVLRCSAHTVVSAMKAGWAVDPTAEGITKTIVQEVRWSTNSMV